MDLEKALKERVKELNCLYGLSRLLEKHGSILPPILQGLADLLPGSWQYPEFTCARVRFEDTVCKSSGFRVTSSMQKASIMVGGEERGTIEVCYLGEMSDLDEVPFLPEERMLLNAVAERMGRAIERILAQKQLEEKQKALERKTLALKEILDRFQEEKRRSSEHIRANLEQVVLPILHGLASRLPHDQRELVMLAERSMMDILSPFTHNLRRTYRSLSPAEIQICNLIRQGLGSKEIARLRGISLYTVHRHRERIREKLRIKKKKVNLAEFLRGDPDAWGDGGLGH